MTSKNLYCKLMKQDLRNRLWLPALAFVTFFFSFPVAAAMISSRYKQYIALKVSTLTEYHNEVLFWFSAKNPLMIFIVIIAALICGLSGFSWLHSQTKVDFYHSLPIKRTKLFFIYSFNGAFVFLLSYLSGLICGYGVIIANGFTVPNLLSSIANAFLYNSCFFLLNYATVILAVMLTGNIIVSILGILVFNFYIPLLSLILTAYRVTFYKTYIWEDQNLIKKGTDFSPVIYYIKSIDNRSLLCVLTAFVIAMILFVLSCFIYKIRPSEASGKALSLNMTKRIIKYPLVILSGIGGFLFFWSIYSSYAWGIFALVCCLLISHCVIEIIYSFDFKMLFSNKKDFAVCSVISAFLITFFAFDLAGFDTYLPEASSVKSASVSFQNFDDWVTYGTVSGPKDTPRLDDQYYYWSYISNNDYIKEHMNLSDIETITSLAKKGIANLSVLNKNFYSDDFYKDNMSFQINYHLNNGKTASRKYTVPWKEIENEFCKLYESREFKTGHYPLMLQAPEDTEDVYYQQFDQITCLNLKDTPSDLSLLLAAYKDDLAALSIDTLKKEIPIATIQFMSKDQKKAIEHNISLRNEDYYMDIHLAQRCFYPIYPSFKNTIDLLKTYGINTAPSDFEAKIESIEIQNYNSKNDEDTVKKIITDKKEIHELLPKLAFNDYVNMNYFYELSDEDKYYVKLFENGTYVEKLFSKLP